MHVNVEIMNVWHTFVILVQVEYHLPYIHCKTLPILLKIGPFRGHVVTRKSVLDKIRGPLVFRLAALSHLVAI